MLTVYSLCMCALITIKICITFTQILNTVETLPFKKKALLNPLLKFIQALNIEESDFVNDESSNRESSADDIIIDENIVNNSDDDKKHIELE